MQPGEHIRHVRSSGTLQTPSGCGLIVYGDASGQQPENNRHDGLPDDARVLCAVRRYRYRSIIACRRANPAVRDRVLMVNSKLKKRER